MYGLIISPETPAQELHDLVKSVIHYFLQFQNTLMLVLMGQFLDHDITLSPESHVALERCCASMDELSEELQDKCFAVRVPEDDTHFNERSSGERQASS